MMSSNPACDWILFSGKDEDGKEFPMPTGQIRRVARYHPNVPQWDSYSRPDGDDPSEVSGHKPGKHHGPHPTAHAPRPMPKRHNKRSNRPTIGP